MTWVEEVFGVTKPILGMCHLGALPGDPGYNPGGGVERLTADAAIEIAALQEGGIDGILISNEMSMPYLTEAEPITAITMARIIGEIHSSIDVPFGVNVLWDGIASVDLATATGADFVREVFTGVYASDFGLWDTNVGRSARHRHRVSGDHVRLLYNIVPEAATYLAPRTAGDLTRSTVFNGLPDGICVSGLTAGLPGDLGVLTAVKEAAGTVPVFANTGVNADNVAEHLAVADGAIVGTYLKEGGVFANRIDPARVSRLMAGVRDLR